MTLHALAGIRIHLSGCVHDDATAEQAHGIQSFVELFARRVLRDGGTVIHGGHPTLISSFRSAAQSFVMAGGNRHSTVLVRPRQSVLTSQDLRDLDDQRTYCAVKLIPSHPDRPEQSLVPMREWMADRCDVVVAISGRHWDSKGPDAGVPQELEETLKLGKPGFIVESFGGAVAEYLREHDNVFARLRNGLNVDANRELSACTDVNALINRIIAQISLLPLRRESVRSGRLFRILALDGGGIRGTFTAAVLAKWDDMLKSGGNNHLVDHFDLVAGTSTGAILAIGLALGLPPLRMLEFYRKCGPKIFPKNRKLRHWLKSKHESETLREVLGQVFGDKKLSNNARCRLVIPTVRATHGQSESIITAHSPDRSAFADMTAVDAALASSAAPTYFDEATYDHPVSTLKFLDGGIWANNPVLPAIAEAVRHLNVPLDRIDLLSIGTLSNETDFTAVLGEGKLGFAPVSADLFFAAQEHAAGVLATSLLGSARHLRVNQQTSAVIPLDDVPAISEMAERGSNVAQDTFIDVRSRFLDGFHATDWRAST